MKTGFTMITATPELLLELREDSKAMKLGRLACPQSERMALAFSFGWRFGGYAPEMTAWEKDSAAFGRDSKRLSRTLPGNEPGFEAHARRSKRSQPKPTQ